MQPICSAEVTFEFPIEDFPIKVMGLAHDSFTESVVDIIVQHDPTFHAGKITVRASSKGKYLGLTASVHASSREQLDNLYRALTSHQMVKMVL